MKIQALLAHNINPHLSLKNRQKEGYKNSQTSLSSMFLQTPSYTLCFMGYSPKYLKARAYLDMVRSSVGGFEEKNFNIYKLDLNKLDGIQEGINVFNDLNLKEIAFISRSLFSVAVKRGCQNLCSHCYAEALPPKKETEEYINKMSWDDFTVLTDGFKELKTRLGFNPVYPTKREGYYITPFHDADCMDLVIKDNSNVEHDFIDIAEKLYDSIGVRPLFDTSGWNPKNKVIQERAEKFVKYYSDNKNFDKIDTFNVSLNPFHILNTKCVLERRLGNIEKADKLEDIYTTRMANTFFTFTPLLKNKNLGIVYRAVDNNFRYPDFEGFKLSDLDDLTEKILRKLKKMYVADLKGEQKYITNKKQIISCIKKVRNEVYDSKKQSYFMLAGRGIETFGKDNLYYPESMNKIIKGNKLFKKAKTPQDLLNVNSMWSSGVLDANGDYYMTTFYSTYPTELKLNFANKNKQTPPISPALQKDIVITKNVINNTNMDDVIL